MFDRLEFVESSGTNSRRQPTAQVSSNQETSYWAPRKEKKNGHESKEGDIREGPDLDLQGLGDFEEG